MLQQLVKKLVPAAALAMSVGLAGCNFDVSVGDGDGVPLAELDQSGPAPTELVLAGPDKVIISDGTELSIEVEGDGADELRFSLDGGTLAISRENDSWNGGETATVRVTMPSPEELVIAGSGNVEAASLAKKAEVLIGGSGNITVATLDADRLEVSVGGSGNMSASGKVDRFDLNIGGSGNIDFANVQIDRAEINIGGNGNVSFASNGTVEANIAGSGDINVAGTADCTLNSFGSGTLNCKPTADEAEEETTQESDDEVEDEDGDGETDSDA